MTVGGSEEEAGKIHTSKQSLNSECLFYVILHACHILEKINSKAIIELNGLSHWKAIITGIKGDPILKVKLDNPNLQLQTIKLAIN